MKKELDEALCAEFQSMFRDRSAPMEESCMYWGFDVGDGWHGLIRAACSYADNVIANAKSNAIYEHKKKHGIAFELELPPGVLKQIGVADMAVIAEQVKEKFGTLRFYWRGEGLPESAHDEIHGAIGMAELLSSVTCEECGAPGERRGPGWLSTRCDSHADGKTTMKEYDAWAREREDSGLDVTGEAWAEYAKSRIDGRPK